MGEPIKLTLGDDSEVTGVSLEDANEKLKELLPREESRHMGRIAQVVKPRLATAKLDRGGITDADAVGVADI